MANFFDHIKNVTIVKGEFLGDEGWNTYMINRYLSMNADYCEAVNIVQKNTRLLTAEQVFNVYKSLLPKKNVFLKYIKATTEKVNPDLMSALREYLECSEREVKEHLEFLNKEDLTEILRSMGKDDSEIKKMLK